MVVRAGSKPQGLQATAPLAHYFRVAASAHGREVHHRGGLLRAAACVHDGVQHFFIAFADLFGVVQGFAFACGDERGGQQRRTVQFQQQLQALAVRHPQANGFARRVAHPARYKFTANEEYALFSEFKAHGGAGVEVVTGSHTAAEYVTYAAMAEEFGLAASRGSDFHSPDESHTDLGTLPYLPGHLTPIWETLADRVRPAT